MIKWNDKLIYARDFFREAHDSIKQVRKYTNAPYWVHTEEVAEIVSEVTDDEDVIIAALSHDIAEDVFPVNSNYTFPLIADKFGPRVHHLIHDLTEKYTKEDYSILNRKERKILEAHRLGLIQNDSKTIKLADLINNTADIAKNDPDFAKIYLKEKEYLLPFLVGGNAILHERASRQVSDLSKLILDN